MRGQMLIYLSIWYKCIVLYYSTGLQGVAYVLFVRRIGSVIWRLIKKTLYNDLDPEIFPAEIAEKNTRIESLKGKCVLV